MAEKETEAMKIIMARRNSYAPMADGYADETELLLLSQHYGELAERKRRRDAEAERAARTFRATQLPK